MKKQVLPLAWFKAIAVTLIIFLCARPALSQDTLHVYYLYTQTGLSDTSIAKIEKWSRNLKGQHVDLTIYGYYHKSEFKKFAVERLDEMFLVLNRKARDLITIKVQEPKKGEIWQRTCVDIIYIPTGSDKVKKEEKKDDKEGKETGALAAVGKVTKEEKEMKEGEEEKTTSNTEPKASKETEKASTEAEKVSKAGSKEEKKEKEKKGKKKDPEALASNNPEGLFTEEKEKGHSQSNKKPAELNGSPGTKPAGAGLNLSTEDVQRVKAAKLVIAKTDNPDIDAMLEHCVKNYWSFNANITTMPYNEAKALAKTDKNVLIFIITDVKSASLKHENAVGAYRYVSHGKSVMLEDGKGKIVQASYFPTYGEEGNVSLESVAYAVSLMNSQLTGMEVHGSDKKMTLAKIMRQNGGA